MPDIVGRGANPRTLLVEKIVDKFTSGHGQAFKTSFGDLEKKVQGKEMLQIHLRPPLNPEVRYAAVGFTKIGEDKHVIKGP